MFQVSDRWKAAFPDAHAGVVVMRGVINPAFHADLEKRKVALEGEIRSRFPSADRAAVENQPVLQAYRAYYHRFKKTYHVQLQLESILKGKSIPKVAALVEAMFMAELDDLLLTAGHDLDRLELPVTLDASRGDESYTLLRGQEQVLKAGDMMMADRAGVVSCILYGPDQRTAINPETRNAMFTTYAPAGIGAQAVKEHLENIQRNVLIFAPAAQVEMVEVFGA